MQKTVIIGNDGKSIEYYPGKLFLLIWSANENETLRLTFWAQFFESEIRKYEENLRLGQFMTNFVWEQKYWSEKEMQLWQGAIVVCFQKLLSKWNKTNNVLSRGTGDWEGDADLFWPREQRRSVSVELIINFSKRVGTNKHGKMRKREDEFDQFSRWKNFDRVGSTQMDWPQDDSRMPYQAPKNETVRAKHNNARSSNAWGTERCQIIISSAILVLSEQ